MDGFGDAVNWLDYEDFLKPLVSGANQAHLQIWCINLSKFKVLIKGLMECYLFQHCRVETANSEK